MTSAARPQWQLDCQHYSTQQSSDLRFRRHSHEQMLKLTHEERMRMTDPDQLELAELRQHQQARNTPPIEPTRHHGHGKARRRPGGDLGYKPVEQASAIIDFHSKGKPKVDTKSPARNKHCTPKVQSYHLPSFKSVKPRIDDQSPAHPKRDPIKVAYGVVRRRGNVPRDPKPADVKELYLRRRELQREATENALTALRQSRKKLAKSKSSAVPSLPSL